MRLRIKTRRPIPLDHKPPLIPTRPTISITHPRIEQQITALAMTRVVRPVRRRRRVRIHPDTLVVARRRVVRGDPVRGHRHLPRLQRSTAGGVPTKARRDQRLVGRPRGSRPDERGERQSPNRGGDDQRHEQGRQEERIAPARPVASARCHDAAPVSSGPELARVVDRAGRWLVVLGARVRVHRPHREVQLTPR